MTTTYAFYQFWLNADDRGVSKFLRIFSFKSREERTAPRRAVASVANRQVRIFPSAVRRVRSQAAQNGRVTVAMMPTR